MLLREHAIEHVEDDLLFGFGEPSDALEAALELARAPWRGPFEAPLGREHQVSLDRLGAIAGMS